MASSSLCCRGLHYDHDHDLPASAAPVAHAYRGHHCAAPLLHLPSTRGQAHDLIYRGTHHQPLHR